MFEDAADQKRLEPAGEDAEEEADHGLGGRQQRPLVIVLGHVRDQRRVWDCNLFFFFFFFRSCRLNEKKKEGDERWSERF